MLIYEGLARLLQLLSGRTCIPKDFEFIDKTAGQLELKQCRANRFDSPRRSLVAENLDDFGPLVLWYLIQDVLNNYFRRSEYVDCTIA